ncbi:MAG: hypothetical protein HY645_08010 [Acidobacteria bacterium]|nr:hypothetical protein [Acidobacteriota bacterium]
MDWTGSVSATAYGVDIGVRVNDPGTLNSILRHLPFGWKPSKPGVVDRLYSVLVIPSSRGRAHRLLYGDRVLLIGTVDLEELLEVFERDVQLYVAEHARRRLFVHAGVVAWAGRALILPGRSQSGKTTLVSELVRVGALYYSDEYAVFDSDGRVHPFAQPLSVREQGAVRKKKLSVAALGGVSGRTSLPVGLVVLAKYEPGRRWSPRRLSPGQGVLELLTHTFSARRNPRAAFKVLGKIVAQAPVIKSPRAEAGEAARRIIELVAKITGQAAPAGRAPE